MIVLRSVLPCELKVSRLLKCAANMKVKMGKEKVQICQANEDWCNQPNGRGFAALGCEATLPPRVNEAEVGQKLSASRISRSHVTFLDNTKSVAMVPVSTNPNKKVQVDLNEVRNGGPAACDNLCMVLT